MGTFGTFGDIWGLWGHLGIFSPTSCDNFFAIATFQTAVVFLTLDWAISVSMETSVVCLNRKDRKGKFDIQRTVHRDIFLL